MLSRWWVVALIAREHDLPSHPNEQRPEVLIGSQHHTILNTFRRHQ